MEEELNVDTTLGVETEEVATDVEETVAEESADQVEASEEI